MHKTIYIDIDEEIIGIINKIRKENVNEIFLVIPKNSLLTQGIINLKLLKKEVIKMKKNVILVTSDQHSKKIIERVGLKTRNKSIQDFVGNKEPEPSNQIKTQPEDLPENVLPQNMKRKIGSSNFYNSDQKSSVEKEESTTPIKNLGLFSTPKNKKIIVATPNTFGEEHIQNYQNKKESETLVDKAPEEKKFRINPAFEEKNENNSQEKALDNFYQDNKAKNDFTKPLKKTRGKKRKKPLNKKIGKILFFIIFILSILIVGYWFILNWPKMTVEIFLKNEVVNTNLDVTVCQEETRDENCLIGKYEELLIEITERYNASGEKFSNDKGMARGIVKIYNNYSSKDQPLVATTRLLSKEGKLFRLIKNTIVPGLTDNQPGMVEVQVIADEVGQDYNVESTEFTIEGFKNSDKYTKFKVISENSMIGGTNDNENKKVKVVTDADINSAREKTIEIFNEKLEENIKKQLTRNEAFVLTSIEKEITNSDSSFASGDIIDQFDYKLQEKVKLMIFNENDLNNLIKSSFNEENLTDLEFDKISKINFTKDISDFESKKLNLSITAEAIYWPILKKTQIKNSLSNKNHTEIKAYLSNLKQIEKAIISYKPSWLSSFSAKNRNINILETK